MEGFFFFFCETGHFFLLSKLNSYSGLSTPCIYMIFFFLKEQFIRLQYESSRNAGNPTWSPESVGELQLIAALAHSLSLFPSLS